MLGALVILRPGGVPLGWGVVFALASSAFYALYIVLTRQVARSDSAATSLAYASLVGLAMSTAIGIFFWQAMEWVDFALVVVTMGTTCAGHGLMVYALTMAPASVLQPFNYFSLPWAIVLSVVVFNQWIDPVSLVGAAIIVAAGLVVMARERRKQFAAVPVAPGKE
ncbi:hypothetical protein DMC47_29105 [Nostoc sp. 3335mG]|nr:hypothetical protein DMC47_29105 [Nostoc sp. 3335mG]